VTPRKPRGGWIARRLLELGIVVCLGLFAVVLFTGPIASIAPGVPVGVTHSYTPLALLLLLALSRLLLAVALAKVLLAVGSLALTLLGVEVALHVMDPPLARPRMTQIHVASPTFGWELVPGATGLGQLGESYRISSAGLRDVEHPNGRRPGTTRIAVIGDSFTFGMGVDLEDSYPKQLERLLNRERPAYEVINFGVIGYNMWQYNEVLARKVLAYAPDLVVLGLFEDDVGGAIAPYGDAPDPSRHPGMNPFQEAADPSALGSVRHLALWNLVRNSKALLEHRYRYRRGATYVESIEARKRWWGPARPMDLNYRIMSGRLGEARYRAFSSALRRFVSTAQDAGVRVLVAMIPDSVQLGDPHLQFVNRFVGQAAAEIGVRFVDTTPFLEAEGDHDSLYLFPYDAHNSPRGLAVIASALAGPVRELGSLASPSR
jgi:hypothetical protein